MKENIINIIKQNILVLICCIIVYYISWTIHSKDTRKFGKFKIGDSVLVSLEYQRKEFDKKARKIYGFLVTKEDVFAYFGDSVANGININCLIFAKEEK